VPAGGTARILIVDDDPTNVLLLSRILGKAGYVVEKAESGTACLEVARRHPPDLVLLDVRMPGMDGFEVCRRLKADERVADVPVIFLTAEGRSDENVSAGFNAGACDYITKPYTRVDVLARVQVSLKQHAKQEAYKQLAGQDPLTGLDNRRRAYERMTEIMSYASRQGEPVSVLMADLDNFKRANDTYGHDFGDTALVAFAQLLQSDSRLEDVVCRYGGEEFLLVLRNTSGDRAVALADRLRQSWANHELHAADGSAVHLTVSFGVACSRLSEDAVNCGDIIKRADVALYTAKKAGRNRVVMSGEVQADSARYVGTSAL
jgi:two-component system cell cycle response regulator